MRLPYFMMILREELRLSIGVQSLRVTSPRITYPSPRGLVMGYDVTRKLSAWHAAIVDWELLYPDRTMKEAARHFDVSEGWLSKLRNSDMFIAYREGRRRDHNEKVSDTVLEKTETVAKVALDVMAERIDNERTDMSMSVLTEAGTMALKALGFGQAQTGRGVNGNPVQINIGVADQDALQEAREHMAQLRTVGETTEVFENDEDQKKLEVLSAPS